MRKEFDLQIKPVGSCCNLLCKYPCYALPFREKKFLIMSDEVLEKTIMGICASNKAKAKIAITWHGGEPMLAGIDFYRKALDFFTFYKKNEQTLHHKMQTNGTLITEEWADFFIEAGFEIGISLDGPQAIHDLNRVAIDGDGSFIEAMRGLKILRQHGLNPSVIATVTVETLKYVDEVFHFLIDNNFDSIKYSPVVDPENDEFSISSEQWFNYLNRVFDLWMINENPDISILDLDEVIAWLDKTNVAMCSSNQECLRWVTVEPNGRMAPCSYIGTKLEYGNIKVIPMEKVSETPVFQQFKKMFLNTPEQCKSCEFFSQCGNGCPATRIKDQKVDYSGVYVYCEERRKLFQKIQQTFIQE